jgi:hypothetical protein
MLNSTGGRTVQYQYPIAMLTIHKMDLQTKFSSCSEEYVIFGFVMTYVFDGLVNEELFLSQIIYEARKQKIV